MAATRAHGVAVDARGANLLAAAPLDRFVDAYHQRTGGRERAHQQTKQDAARAQARPHRAIEDAGIGLGGGELAPPPPPQDPADPAPAPHAESSRPPQGALAPDTPRR